MTPANSITRIGLTPIKGLRHAARDEVWLGVAGPDGDRLFAFAADGQILKTVRHPELIAAVASYDGRLRWRLPGGEAVEAVPRTGAPTVVDYWGRQVCAKTVIGPWAQAAADLLGKRVELVQAAPGDFVFGESVSVVRTADLEALSNPDPARFRATFVVDTDQTLRSGQRWRLGGAVIQISAPIVRCAVINYDPATGEHNADLLRRLRPELHLGVAATVSTPGLARLGDRVTLQAGPAPESTCP